jgi:hypothetical protein
MRDWATIGKAVAMGTAIGIVIGLGGFFFARAGSQGMGFTMFLLVPVAAGFSVALLTRKPNTSVAAALFAVVATLVILIAVGLEGILCALMALPFLLAGVLIGLLLGKVTKLVTARYKARNISVLFVLPVALLSVGKQIERPMLDHPRTEIVSSTVRVADTPEHTWAYIQSIDSIQSKKPWLMHVGLPIPQRCTLERTGEGARRTCYFDHGYIEETVTQWERPNYMELRIDRTHMPGRHWLGFETASYRLQRDGNSTLVTRTTVVESHLAPSWYWRPLERWGVESEHEYILSDLATRADAGRP